MEIGEEKLMDTTHFSPLVNLSFLAGIRSLCNAKVWRHSQDYILLQPQSDCLVLLVTNAGRCPSCHGVMRTPLLCYSKVIVQPITGAELCILLYTHTHTHTHTHTQGISSL